MKGLKDIRKEKGFSQLQLAEFLHISPSTVAQWELGEKNASAGQTISLCRILGCMPEDLFLPYNKVASETPETIPVFYGRGYSHVTLLPLPAAHPLSDCQFGIVVGQDLSGRICKGDICYFKLCGNCCINDTVISLGNDSSEKLFIADKNNISDSSIVAVCRYMQSRL